MFANLSVLKDYEREFKLDDFEGKELEFKLEFSPKQSANLYYKNAKKLEQKAKNLNIQRQNLKEKLDFTLSLKELLLQAKSEIELEILLPKKNSKKIKIINKKILWQIFILTSLKFAWVKMKKAMNFYLKMLKKMICGFM